MSTLIYLAGALVVLGLAVLAQNVPSEWAPPIVAAAWLTGAVQIYGISKRGERS